MVKQPVRVGVLVDGDSLREWQRQSLDELVESDQLDVSIELVVRNNTAEGGLSSLAQELSMPVLLFGLLYGYGLVKNVMTAPPWYRRSVSLDAIESLSDAETVTCAPLPASGIGNCLPADIVDRLGELDLVVRFGFGILKGDALTAPEYGVLSYHHGDLREYRGRPAGFYEFLDGASSAGVTVQRLNEGLDSGEIASFERVGIEDASSWREVKDRLFSVTPFLLPSAVLTCVSDAEHLKQPSKLGDLYTVPSNSDVLRYIYLRIVSLV